MKGRAWRAGKGRIQVHFIHQDARADASRDFADLLQNAVLGQHAAGIVQIGEDDQPRARCYRAFNLARFDGKVILKAPRKPADLCA